MRFPIPQGHFGLWFHHIKSNLKLFLSQICMSLTLYNLTFNPYQTSLFFLPSYSSVKGCLFQKLEMEQPSKTTESCPPGSQWQNRSSTCTRNPKRGIEGVVIKTLGHTNCKSKHAIPLVPFSKVCKSTRREQVSAISLPSSDFCRICMAASACRGSEVATLVQWHCLKPSGWQQTVRVIWIRGLPFSKRVNDVKWHSFRNVKNIYRK